MRVLCIRKKVNSATVEYSKHFICLQGEISRWYDLTTETYFIVSYKNWSVIYQYKWFITHPILIFFLHKLAVDWGFWFNAARHPFQERLLRWHKERRQEPQTDGVRGLQGRRGGFWGRQWCPQRYPRRSRAGGGRGQAGQQSVFQSNSCWDRSVVRDISLCLCSNMVTYTLKGLKDLRMFHKDCLHLVFISALRGGGGGRRNLLECRGHSKIWKVLCPLSFAIESNPAYILTC